MTTDDDHRLDDLNKLDVTTFPVAEVGVQAIVVDSVMGVVVAAVGEDGEDVRNDEARQMDLIATMMMIEAKKIRTNRCEGEKARWTRSNAPIWLDGRDCTMRESWNHLDYVDCTMMNVKSSSVDEVEVPTRLEDEDWIDHHLDRPRRLISTTRHSNHVRRSRDPWVICLSNKWCNDEWNYRTIHGPNKWHERGANRRLVSWSLMVDLLFLIPTDEIEALGSLESSTKRRENEVFSFGRQQTNGY